MKARVQPGAAGAPPANEDCPSCGIRGKTVKEITVDSMLTNEAKSRLSKTEGFRFCGTRDCPVAYYRPGDGETIPPEDVRVRIFQKCTDVHRPVCYCFNHSVKEIETEIAGTGTTSVPDSIKAQCSRGLDDCARNNPQGSCCLGNVSRVVKAGQAECSSRPAGVGTSVSESETLEDDSCCASDHAETPGQTLTPIAVRPLGLLAAGGAVLTAVLSSACCWLPLLLIAFGASAFGVSAFVETYRPYLLGTTGLLLGAGFYLVYFREKRCETGTSCSTTARRINRMNNAMLWVGSAVIAAFALFPNYVGVLAGGRNDQFPVVATGVENRVLPIEGMTCEGCAANLQSRLSEVPGVVRAEVSYEAATATVFFESQVMEPDGSAIAEAVRKAGYRVKSATGPAVGK